MSLAASQNDQKTANTDARVVGGDNSTNVSAGNNSGSVTVTSTDFGAVHDSLQLALAGVEGAHHTTDTTIAEAGGLLEGALKNSGQQAQAFVDTIKDVKTGDVRVLVIAGLAIVGLGAVMLFKNKG